MDADAMLKEFVATKERATAWVFRLLISFATAACGVVGYLAWGVLTDVKTKSETGIQLQWTAIGKINDAQAQASRDVATITQKLDDHVKYETEIDSQLKDLAKDHEQRIRDLERPH